MARCVLHYPRIIINDLCCIMNRQDILLKDLKDRFASDDVRTIIGFYHRIPSTFPKELMSRKIIRTAEGTQLTA
jgi:hypothetical protein